MKNVSLAIIVALLTPMATSMGDDNSDKPKSSGSDIATAIDQYETDVRALDRRFREEMTRLEESYVAERESMRESLTKLLEKQKKTLMAKGELEPAVQIRDQIEVLQASKIAPPSAESTVSSGRTATTTFGVSGIVGTWRWNNGVDIRNLDNGKTNGNGMWRLIDPTEDVYEFHWSRIAPDRVRMSENGRVLEGTKSNDPGFRVWAVRID